jgi:hypothetical protein
MSIAIALSYFALGPLIEANNQFEKNSWSGTACGKLLAASAVLTNALALPFILGLGLLESLVCACKGDGYKIVKDSLLFTLRSFVIQFGAALISAKVALPWTTDVSNIESINRIF